jgi:hypothetical protein
MIAAAAVVLLAAVALGVVRRSRPAGLSIGALRAVAILSTPDQREWVEAMIAEHDSLADERSRRRFARGCLRAVVFHGGPPDATAVLGASVIGLGAASAVAVAIYGLVDYPGMRAGWVWAVYLAVFVGLVAVYACVGLRLVRLGSRTVRAVGLAAASPTALSAWWAARSDSVLSFSAAILFVVPLAIAAGFIARRQRRVDDAVVAAGCGGVAAGLLTFIVYGLRTYATDGGTVTPSSLQQFARSGAHDYATWAVGENLAGAVFLLLAVPVLAVVLGVVVARAMAPRGSVRS